MAEMAAMIKVEASKPGWLGSGGRQNKTISVNAVKKGMLAPRLIMTSRRILPSFASQTGRSVARPMKKPAKSIRQAITRLNAPLRAIVPREGTSLEPRTTDIGSPVHRDLVQSQVKESFEKGGMPESGVLPGCLSLISFI
jgi:hypothetical protein